MPPFQNQSVLFTDLFKKLEEMKDSLQWRAGTGLHSIMTSCHSLALLNGELIGDPLEKSMFLQTGASLTDQETLSVHDDEQIIYLASMKSQNQIEPNWHICRRFDFESKLQRMSVIAKKEGEGHFNLFAKGSPEKI